MTVKCPVCEQEIDGRKKQCPNCGFADFRKEFINQDDADTWLQETVEPCRSVYRRMKKHNDFHEKMQSFYEKSNRDLINYLNELCLSSLQNQTGTVDFIEQVVCGIEKNVDDTNSFLIKIMDEMTEEN